MPNSLDSIRFDSTRVAPVCLAVFGLVQSLGPSALRPGHAPLVTIILVQFVVFTSFFQNDRGVFPFSRDAVHARSCLVQPLAQLAT